MTAFNNRNRDNNKTEWLTPPYIIRALGQFDLDPCAPIVRPWETANHHYTTNENGLAQEWVGRVWCNPPYDTATRWVKRLAQHGNGIALIFARTDTVMWYRHIWEHAHALLFIQGRLTFYHVTGEKARKNGGAPSVLVAYGEENAECLKRCGIKGKYLELHPTVIAKREPLQPALFVIETAAETSKEPVS